MAAAKLCPLQTTRHVIFNQFHGSSSSSLPQVSPIRSSFYGRSFAFQKLNLSSSILRQQPRPSTVISAALFSIQLEHNGESRTIEVPEDETILSVALDEGMDLPHDCKLGVCMTCPAMIVSGNVDQSEGMLSDDVQEKGYALLCASYPRSDCKIRVIPEEELLSLQLATAND